MQGLALTCNCCESRREQGFKPLSYLEGGLGGRDEGIKESAPFCTISPWLSGPTSPPQPTLVLTSAHIYTLQTYVVIERHKPAGCYEGLHTNTHPRVRPRLSSGDEWHFLLGHAFFLSLNLLLSYLFFSPHIFMLLIPAPRWHFPRTSTVLKHLPCLRKSQFKNRIT